MKIKSDFRKSVLSNGVRLVTERTPWMKSLSIGIWVNHGSRYEPDSEQGLAHFLEHMLFKGTSFRSCHEISRVIERTGGDINAFTSRENCCYHVLCLPEHLSLAADVLVDVVTRPTFPAEEIELEKKVVLQEILMTEDDPEEWINEVWFEKAFKGQALGRSILGSKESVEAYTQATLRTYHSHYYQNSNLIVSAAGDIDHDSLKESLTRSFERGDLREKAFFSPSSNEKLSEKPEFHTGRFKIERELEQVLMIMGFPTIGFLDDARYASSLLSTYLGGGMSSCLFQEIREKRGLAYNVSTSYTPYQEMGIFDVMVGTRLGQEEECLKIVQAELQKLSEEGISEEDLQGAKEMLKGGIILAEDDVDERMNTLALSELRFGKVVTLDEALKKVDRITREEIQDLSKSVFNWESSLTVEMGSFEKGESSEEASS